MLHHKIFADATQVVGDSKHNNNNNNNNVRAKPYFLGILGVKFMTCFPHQTVHAALLVRQL
jgi:hypothetical protein